jgi:hypothetical protein
MAESTSAANGTATSSSTAWAALDSLACIDEANIATFSSQDASAECTSVWQVQTIDSNESSAAAAAAWDSACQLPNLSKLLDSVLDSGDAANLAAVTAAAAAEDTPVVGPGVLQLPTPDSRTFEPAATSTGSAVDTEAAGAWDALELLSRD